MNSKETISYKNIKIIFSREKVLVELQNIRRKNLESSVLSENERFDESWSWW